jgi:hypothetical protein
MQAAPIIPMYVDQRTFMGGCAALSLVQVITSVAIMLTMRKIAGTVIPPDAAEAYAAGYAVGAVRGDRRQDVRRTGRRSRAADRARQRREDGNAS